jgi:thiamine kinase-like enzyme
VSGSISPADVLATIPGWRGAAFSKLPGGLTNETLLVEKDGRRAVLKIDPSPRRPPYNSRRAEAEIQNGAASIGRANKVLHVSDMVLLSEWADGEVWTRTAFDDDDRLARLATALRDVHGLSLTGRRFDAAAAARQYFPAAARIDAELARRKLQIVESTPPPSNLCCCHNDLVAENILEAPAIRFLDWEYACNNDPMFDLAIVVGHHGLSDRQAGVLLEAYFDGNGERWRDALTVQVRQYDALLGLWAAANAPVAENE